MKNPEIPKQSADTPQEALKNLRNDVQLPPEAIPERDAVVDEIARQRDKRLVFAQEMRKTGTAHPDLSKLEAILTV